MQGFDHAHATTQGARDYQEDSVLLQQGPEMRSLDPVGASPRPDGQTAQVQTVDGGSIDGVAPQLVAVLADGMGGHAGGATASKTVCASFVESFAKSDGNIRERLVGSLRLANDAVRQVTDDDPMLDGMGSTMIGAVFGPDGVEWVSVGDSPLMLFRRGEIALLNEDHSLAPELDRLAAAGSISEDEAKRDPRRHMLRSAITGDEIELVDVSRTPLKLELGDYVILASDGLQTLETHEIERIVSAYGSDGARSVCDALIRAVEAVRDPHQDNATVLAVRLVDTPKS